MIFFFFSRITRQVVTLYSLRNFNTNVNAIKPKNKQRGRDEHDFMTPSRRQKIREYKIKYTQTAEGVRIFSTQ